jgi:L-threonylcarbamoyladenylate synthase
METATAAVAEVLKRGGIAVIPTDTIYGVVCSALSPEAVERLYTVRGRNGRKACIVLIDDPKRLAEFGITLTGEERVLLERVWPGKVSVVFPTPGGDLRYLHRGGGSTAFRVSADEELRALLRDTGPLLAPSANPEGRSPATTIGEARAYFGETVDAYLDGGQIVGSSSTITQIQNGKFVIIRPGAVPL